jgi:hypothetical protein
MTGDEQEHNAGKKHVAFELEIVVVQDSKLADNLV